MRAEDLECKAAELEASGEYRVLRRLAPRSQISQPDGAEVRKALFLDVETTGLDCSRDEIIELAVVPFTYGLDGRVYEIGEPFHALREPTIPIPIEVTRLTGLDDTAVAGKSIDLDLLASLVAPAALILAHNAAFDRRFAERLLGLFANKAWACSMSQIDWRTEGFETLKLSQLAAEAGFFYDRHRAIHDCHAAIELLARPLRSSGRPALAHLLEAARRPTVRIWAESSPFELKEVLKRRGYRWNPEGNPAPRAWYIDVDEAAADDELRFLRTEIYQRDVIPTVKRITAYDRFSDRT